MTAITLTDLLDTLAQAGRLDLADALLDALDEAGALPEPVDDVAQAAQRELVLVA